MRTLNFPNFPYSLVKLDTLPTENSCFFHAILQSFHIGYRNSTSIMEKTLLTRSLRNTLAKTLQTIDESGKTVYETLSNGKLKEFAEEIKGETDEYTMNAMIKTLESCSMITDAFLELVSNALEIDIYVLNENTLDIYYQTNEDVLLYKGRNSIVISWKNNHYSTIGIRNGDKITTYFCSSHNFIEFLRQKIKTHKK